jgi:hypothetical protein
MEMVLSGELLPATFHAWWGSTNICAVQDHASDVGPADPVVREVPVHGLPTVGGRGSADAGGEHHPAFPSLASVVI